VMRRVLSRFVQAFVTVSDDLRRWLTNVVGIPAAKVTRICNGVDTERFRPPQPGEPSPLPSDVFDERVLVIGSVTRFSAIKDPLNLVEAFIRVRNSGLESAKALRLLMIGDGDLRERALRRLEDSGHARAAWLPGSRSDIPELLRSMDLFVLGSLREGISNTILEAMATGLPVIASATGGNPELIVAGETGALVPPGDSAGVAAAIDAYARDPALCARHGRAARARAVAEFSIAAMLAGYQRLYDHTLAEA
jgi:sugar transferase (PEP-CTERM/EpsH1 system associated)